jgi:hypothetical protein
MYKIIGADHREYGPVPAERVKQWILEGRANAQSKVQPEGGEWRSLGELTEFAEELRAQAASAPPPPRIASTEADRMAAAIVQRDYAVDIGGWFAKAWQMLQQDFWLFVGASAVVLVLALGIATVPVIGTVAIFPLAFVLWGSLGWLFLKRIRGEQADMGDAFGGFTLAFVPLFLGGLVASALTVAGLVLCVVPGLYLLVIWWGFVPLLIIDKRLDFWPAMELSRKVVHHHFWPMAALILCVLAVGTSGLIVFLVGVFLTMPFAVAASVYAYEDIFGRIDPGALPATAPAPLPPVWSAPPAATSGPNEGGSAAPSASAGAESPAESEPKPPGS